MVLPLVGVGSELVGGEVGTAPDRVGKPRGFPSTDMGASPDETEYSQVAAVVTAVEGTDRMDKLLSVEDVAELLGISIHSVYAWASKGRLPVVKIGTRTMFSPGEIARWVAENSRPERTRQLRP